MPDTKGRSMPLNPHDFLDGLTPRAKGILNERIVADWLYRWQYSSAALIQARLCKQASGWASLAVKRKFIFRPPEVSRWATLLEQSAKINKWAKAPDSLTNPREP